MEKDDKGSTMIRMGVGECLFWYRPTQVVPDQRPLNGRCCCCQLSQGAWGQLIPGNEKKLKI